jgi:inward rectifier potassium channel
MAFTKKINTGSKSNPDTGFGEQASQIGGRFVNKDGSFNLRKEGWPLSKTRSAYSMLLEMSWLKLLTVIVLFYVFINVLFTALYLLVGYDQLTGIIADTHWARVKEIFYFSTQTFTTVGYGRVNPVADGANIVASLETMTGWLFFALVTSLLYGRFTQPKAYIGFSHNALIAPYKNGLGLMFRMVPYKNNHHLTDAQVVVNIAFTVEEAGKPQFKFYQLDLERSRIDAFSMNWTVVHPIDERSPLLNATKEDLQHWDVELYVQVSGFSPVFSNTVLQRTSYTYHEIVWGAKFTPMYRESPDGNTTIIELHKLNDYKLIAIE